MNTSPRIAPPPAAPTKSCPRVLVADDCAGTRDVLAQMLRGDYEPVLLDNGSSAWERIQQDASIAALITDIEMPGLNGFELIANLRGASEARLRNMPIIAITGGADQETRRRAFISGATGLITKPINRNQLLDLAHAYVREVPADVLASAMPVAEDVAPTTVSPPVVEPVQPCLESIEFDAEPVHIDEPEPVAIPAIMVPVAVPVPNPMDALSVSDIEAMIRQDVGAAKAAVIPAELIGIDAALEAIGAGHGDLLTPYLPQLKQRLQPLLARYREHFGHDLGAT